MSDNPAPGGETPQPLPQHPLVARLKPDIAQPARQVIELVGLPGDSDRAGHQRLYLTARLDYYAELLIEDIVYSEAVPADASPIAGQEATRVGIRRDATINYTWVRSPEPVDEFDLDVRLGAAMAAGLAPAFISGHPGAPCGLHTVGGQATCPITYCNTCPNTKCNTCPNTCAATCPNTCHETCGCPTKLCTHVGLDC